MQPRSVFRSVRKRYPDFFYPFFGHNNLPPLRPCLNFIRPSWNGWNGTSLFVVVRSIPTCFQVFVSIPTTKRKSSNSCELNAIGNILNCQYKTLGTIVTHRLQVGCLEHTHAPLPPLLSHSRDMTTARPGPVLSHGAGKGDRGPRQGSSSRGGGGHPARRASSVFVATFVCPGSMSDCGGLVSMLKSLSLFYRIHRLNPIVCVLSWAGV